MVYIAPFFIVHRLPETDLPFGHPVTQGMTLTHQSDTRGLQCQ